MLKEMLKKLSADFGFVKEEITDVEKDVMSRLDRSVKLDEVDTITFGLETDDGKIVKVYVKADQADEFEKALAEKLGKVDDIEEVLNELSKEYEIVDVEWPSEEVETETDEDDGSDSLDPKVYDNKHEKDAEGTKIKPSMEGLNIGEKFTLQIQEAGSDEHAGTLESRFTTPSQLMVYHAILELGIPELALARNPYRAAIIKNIKAKAQELQNSASMKNALKVFINRSVDYEEKAEKNKAAMSGKKVEESITLNEGTTQDFWEFFIQLVNYLSPKPEVAKSFLESSQLKQLMTRSSSAITSKVTSQLKGKLNDLKNAMGSDKAGAQLKAAGVTESASPDEVTELFSTLLTIADPSRDGSSAAAVLKNSAWNQFFNQVKPNLSQKFSGTLRSKLNSLKLAMPGTNATPTSGSAKGTGAQNVGQTTAQSQGSAQTSEAPRNFNAKLKNNYSYGSEKFDAGHSIEVIGEEGDSYIVKAFPIMANGNLKLKKRDVELFGKINTPIGGSGGAMPGGLNTPMIEDAQPSWSFENEGDNFVVQCGTIKVTLNPEETEKLVKGVTNKDAVVVKDEEDPTHKVAFSPRGSSVLVKKVGTPDGVMMKSKDIDGMLDFISKGSDLEVKDEGDEEKKGESETPDEKATVKEAAEAGSKWDAMTPAQRELVLKKDPSMRSPRWKELVAKLSNTKYADMSQLQKDMVAHFKL